MTKRKKIALIFGTRPEAIKMAPLVREIKKQKNDFDLSVIVTAQHRRMLDQVMDFFEMTANIDLDLMVPNQTLPGLTASALTSLSAALNELKPDLILVQGDTTTAFVGALAAFYQKIPVGHVEAGLRTHDISAPFPEEANRHLISVISRWHFAPTKRSADSLLREGIDPKCIFTTGNTVVDALQTGLQILENTPNIRNKLKAWFHQSIPEAAHIESKKSRLILITGHRRESFGTGFESICNALRDLAHKYSEDSFVYPVHLNPHVQGPVFKILSGIQNVHLIEPVEYSKMLFLLQYTHLILTDSGGIQEEAPSLQIPTLVMRDKTERPEGVSLGAVKLVGNQQQVIFTEACQLLDHPEAYKKMQITHNPYGDGLASQKILTAIRENF